MVIQIGGIVILTVSIICGTWYAVTIRKMEDKKAAEAKKRREARNERIFNNDALSLYEDEKQRRMALETRLGIVEHQLAMAKEQMAKIKIKEVK